MPRYLPPDEKRCTRINKHNKERCKNVRCLPTTKCYKHGGRVPRGLASPHWRNKGRSRYLPTALADQYLAALNDPDLLAIDKDIALIDVRMNELTGKLDASDMGKLWVDVHTAWLAMEHAQAAGDVEGMRVYYDLIGPLIKRAANSRYLWQDLIQTAKNLAILRLSEHKRLVDLRTMMTEGQMLQAVGLIQHAVREAILSRVEAKVARDILTDIQARMATFVEVNRGQGLSGRSA